MKLLNSFIDHATELSLNDHGGRKSTIGREGRRFLLLRPFSGTGRGSRRLLGEQAPADSMVQVWQDRRSRRRVGRLCCIFLGKKRWVKSHQMWDGARYLVSQVVAAAAATELGRDLALDLRVLGQLGRLNFHSFRISSEFGHLITALQRKCKPQIAVF